VFHVTRAIQYGFTLIELMITVAIIGVLAAFALPALMDYIARSQTSEAVNLLASGKSPMGEYFSDRGYWPSTASDVMGNTSGKYTASIAIIDATGQGLTLQATMKSANINANVMGGTVLFGTADGGRHWTCTSGGSQPISGRFLPGACR
jgi:type IV pilus assembly protein PilA